MQFHNHLPAQRGLIFQQPAGEIAIAQKKYLAGIGGEFSTDGAIEAYGLQKMRDKAGAFSKPPQLGMPIHDGQFTARNVAAQPVIVAQANAG